ncbi:MAG: hypothetical protein E7539_01985 [Ruminococcaceae bacterium]|nr:hypothetical protein [Oscillospiraceae bacterium]
MYKKISAFFLALALLCALLIGCGKAETIKDNSSHISKNESSFVESETSKIETSSETSSQKPVQSSSSQHIKVETSSNESKEIPVASVSSSQSVKVYSNPGNVGMMCFSLSMNYTTAYGEDLESRKKYFEEMANSGFFNQYILHLGEYFMDEVEIIAKAGGSFWINCTKQGALVDKNLDSYISDFEGIIDNLRKKGYADLLNGFFWDEPLWSKTISNEQFLKLTKGLYQKFGLRNFPVFAVGEFTRLNGNEDEVPPTTITQKVTTYSMRYLTDVAFDSYSVDVREGAGNEWMFNRWQKEVSPYVVDGKSYYTEHRRLITERAGHPVNFWHFPCAWDSSVSGGLNGIRKADEAYWIAHLDFMAQDVLDYEYPGGLCIYTFRRVDADSRDCFERRMDLKNENGEWAVWPDTEKYLTYSEKLRGWCEKFSSTKVGLKSLDT